MANIFGMAQLNVSDYNFAIDADQQILYNVTKEYLAAWNAAMQAAMAVFVQPTPTTLIAERYKLPGGGRLQRRSKTTQAGAVAQVGEWDVAYDFELFGAQVASTQRDLALMSPAEYELHIDTVTNQASHTVRFEILKHILNNVNATFVDEKRGTLTIRRLANTDGTLYPPVIGSETEAQENHYIVSGYTAANINDTNNPYPVLVRELTEHFGVMTGNENVIAFINSAQTALTQALSNFIEVPDMFITPGVNANVPNRLPMAPGKILGRINGAWVSEWDWIPANYAAAVHLDQPQPLKMRVDPPNPRLPQGLTLVAEDSIYPIESSHWEYNFGFGASNRLNGVIMEFTTDGTYDIPATYA